MPIVTVMLKAAESHWECLLYHLHSYEVGQCPSL